MAKEQQLLRQSSLLLQNFASLIGHRIDLQRAERLLYESHLNESSKPFEDWLDTVTSCAEGLEFRIRRVESSLTEVTDLVKGGIPTAYLATSDSEGDTWHLITKAYRSRLQIRSLRSGKVEWVSIRKLAGRFGLSSENDAASWLVSYPILINDASTAHGVDNEIQDVHDSHHGHGHGIPPLR